MESKSPSISLKTSRLASSIVKTTACVAPIRKFSSPYEDDATFEAALELYNKQMENADGSSGSSNLPQKWEYKGEIRASFQLCISCDDVGKVRSHKDKYYLDVMEVRKYRTILCKDCLGYILHQYVGGCLDEIQEKLQELNE